MANPLKNVLSGIAYAGKNALSQFIDYTGVNKSSTPASQQIQTFDPGQYGGGQYLSNGVKEYMSHFKDADDLMTRGKFKDDAQKKAYLDASDYYYAKTPDEKLVYDNIYGTMSQRSNKINELRNDPKYTIQRGDKTISQGISENIANYIYDEAVRGGEDPWTALALAYRESSVGNAKTRQNKDGSINAFNLMSYWAGNNDPVSYGEKHYKNYNNAVDYFFDNNHQFKDDKMKQQYLDAVKAAKYDADQMKPYEGDNVVADAVKYFKSGKYNPNDVDYINKVMRDADTLKNDTRFMQWYNSKGKK